MAPRLVALLAGLAAMSGCVHATGGGHALCLPCAPACRTIEADLIERGMVNADVPLLASEPPLAPVPDAANYHLLTAQDCQFHAAARAVTAYLVDVERQLAIASTPARPASRKAKALRVHRQLLSLRGAQIRNDAAGDALEAYYQLAAAEAGIDVLDRSRDHVRQVLGYAAELEQQGLPVPLDTSALGQQELDLAARRAELEWNVAQLNGRLRLLLGWCLEGPVRVWPQTDLIVERAPVDVAAAVQTGLASRPDLATLRLLSTTLEEATLPLVRGALQTQDATLGNVTSGFERLGQLLRPARGDDELRARRAQLSTLLVEKERELVVAIHAAAGAVEMHRDRAVLAKQALESARVRLSELERLRDVGQATPFDVATQRGKVLEAETTLVERAAAWRLAEVELRQTLGVLARECCE
jgi:hypothetical protein